MATTPFDKPSPSNDRCLIVFATLSGSSSCPGIRMRIILLRGLALFLPHADSRNERGLIICGMSGTIRGRCAN